MNYAFLFLTSTTFIPVSNSLHPIQQNPTSVLDDEVLLSQTNTNTFYVSPLLTKRAVPFSLALRLRCICPSDESFTLLANELIQYLNDRGYNLYFLKRKLKEFTK